MVSKEDLISKLMGKSVVRKIKEQGVKGIWRYFQYNILRIDYHKAHYLRLDIDIDETNKLLEDFDLKVKELVYEDFLKGNPNVFKGTKMELYKQRFQDQTYKAFGIIENNRLVYSAWISLHRLGMSVERHPYYLLPAEGYLEDAYCDPVARGRGLHGKMNNFRIKKIYEAGKKRVIVIIQDGNTPAMKVQLKSGFQEVGHFYHGYIFGIKFNTLNKSKFDNR